MEQPIAAREREIEDEIAILQDLDWEALYQYIIEMGEALPPLDERFKIEQFEVAGCLAKVWLRPIVRDGLLFFEADSNSEIVKGLVALLLRLLSGLPPQVIAHASLGLLDRSGVLREHFTSRRKNGLDAMVKKMQRYARAFAEQESERREP